MPPCNRPGYHVAIERLELLPTISTSLLSIEEEDEGWEKWEEGGNFLRGSFDLFSAVVCYFPRALFISPGQARAEGRGSHNRPFCGQ